MKKKIYFGGSIRGGRQDQKIYSELIAHTQSAGAEVLCEHVGYADLTDQGQNLDPVQIHDRDIAWIKEADGMIAEVTNPSLGVGYEVQYALAAQKPVLALFAKTVDGPRLSAMIAGAASMYPNLTNYEYDRGPNGIQIAKLAINKFLETLN